MYLFWDAINCNSMGIEGERKMSPTARSLQRLRKEGYIAGVVEKTIGHTFIKQDLFGFIDIIAASEEEGIIIGIQATAAGSTSARITKSLALPALKVWLLAGGKFSVWGWGKKGGFGTAKRWQLNEYVFTIEKYQDRTAIFVRFNGEIVKQH